MRLGGWPVISPGWDQNSFDWKETVYRNRRIGYSIDYFITLSVRTDEKNYPKRVIIVSINQLNDFLKLKKLLKYYGHLM